MAAHRHNARPLPRFDAILLDMDGLMIDTEGLYWDAAREIAAGYGRTVGDETLRAMMGRGPLESMRVFVHDLALPDPAEVILEQRTKIMRERFRRPISPMPGLMEFLGAFKGRLKLAVATSAPAEFVDLILPSMGLVDDFEVIQTSDDIAQGKPNPEIYLKTIARLEVEARRSVVLEDSIAGARAGKNAGAYTIAVPSDYTRSGDFSFADFQARDLRDARDHIASLMD